MYSQTLRSQYVVFTYDLPWLQNRWLNDHRLATLEAGTFDGTPALEFL